jgi:hypothetical protein
MLNWLVITTDCVTTMCNYHGLIRWEESRWSCLSYIYSHSMSVLVKV